MGNYDNFLLSLRLRKKAKIIGVSVQSVAKIIVECDELSRESLLSKNDQYSYSSLKKEKTAC